MSALDLDMIERDGRVAFDEREPVGARGHARKRLAAASPALVAEIRRLQAVEEAVRCERAIAVLAVAEERIRAAADNEPDAREARARRDDADIVGRLRRAVSRG